MDFYVNVRKTTLRMFYKKPGFALVLKSGVDGSGKPGEGCARLCAVLVANSPNKC
jgi:hypothetical protein